MPRTQKSARQLFRELLGHLEPRRRKQLALLLLLMLAGSMAEIVTIGAVVPFISFMAKPELANSYPWLQQFFATFGWRQPDSLVLPMSVAFVGIIVVATGIRLLLLYATNKLVFAMGYDLSVRLYSLILNQPYAYHIGRNTSEILGDINKVQILLGSVMRPFMDGFASVILAVAILVALMLVDAATALSAGLLFAAMYLLVIWLFRARLLQNSVVIATAQAARVRAIQEGLGGIRDVILDDNQLHYSQVFSRLDRQYRDALASNAIFAQSPRFIVEAIGVALIVALAYILSLQQGGLVAALPVLAALALGAQRLLPLIQRIYNAWAQFTGNVQVINDVLEGLDLPARDTRSKRISSLAFDRAIELRNVGFRYGINETDVLKDVSVSIPKGARVGIVGQTGSGKSTLLDVVMGLLQPTRGTLRVDGVAIDATNRRDWQRHIAHVPQHIYLSDASISENIALGIHPDRIDEKRIRCVARQAQIAEFIESGRNGYETKVGERGIQLSGGQRQRIGIARALYKKADVLVFDEASSALDNDTETAVMNAVDKLDPELTLFIIAHRVQTLRNCDLVMRLESGRIVESGSFSKIIGPRSDHNQTKSTNKADKSA